MKLKRDWPLLAAVLLLLAGVAMYLDTRDGVVAVMMSMASALVLLIYAIQVSPPTGAYISAAKRLYVYVSPREDGLPSGPRRTSIALLVLTGLALSYFVDDTGHLRFLHHLGLGLIVAGTVSAVWQLPEMKSFFVELAVAVMVDAKYLTKLQKEDLQKMREKSIQAMMRRFAKNPAYEIHAIATWLDRLLLGSLLPSEVPGTGIYRKDYREQVVLEFISLGEALDQWKLKPGSEEHRAFKLVKQTSITTYTVVAPGTKPPPYRANLIVWAADIPGFPVDRRVSVRSGTLQTDAQPMKLENKNDPNAGEIFSGHSLHEFKDGIATVWIETVEYRSLESESWIFNSVNVLTHRLDTHIYVKGDTEELSFDGRVTGGLGLETPHTTYLPNGIAFRYDGWLLADHGYFVWWWKKVNPDSIVSALPDAAAQADAPAAGAIPASTIAGPDSHENTADP